MPRAPRSCTCVRDDDGMHSLTSGRYREAHEAVRATSDICIQPSSETWGQIFARRHDGRAALARPEMISPQPERAAGAGRQSQSAAVRDFLAETASRHGAAIHRPRLVAVALLQRWWDAGWVPQRRPSVLLVIGRNGAAPEQPARRARLPASAAGRLALGSVCSDRRNSPA